MRDTHSWMSLPPSAKGAPKVGVPDGSPGWLPGWLFAWVGSLAPIAAARHAVACHRKRPSRAMGEERRILIIAGGAFLAFPKGARDPRVWGESASCGAVSVTAALQWVGACRAIAFLPSALRPLTSVERNLGGLGRAAATRRSLYGVDGWVVLSTRVNATRRTAASAGVTPGRRSASPRVAGRRAASTWTASFFRPRSWQ
jgi:hypothetical protein